MKNQAKTTNKSDNFDIKAIYEELQSIKEQVKKLKDNESKIKKAIFGYYENEIKHAYKQKDEPFGVVHIEDKGVKLSLTTPKKVEWDQAGLLEVLQDGGPVKQVLSVSETTFKELNDEGRAALMPFRTISPGSVSLELEITEG